MVGGKTKDDQNNDTLATLLADAGHEELFIEAISQVASSMRHDIDQIFELPKWRVEDNIQLKLDDEGNAESHEAPPPLPQRPDKTAGDKTPPPLPSRPGSNKSSTTDLKKAALENEPPPLPARPGSDLSLSADPKKAKAEAKAQEKTAKQQEKQHANAVKQHEKQEAAAAKKQEKQEAAAVKQDEKQKASAVKQREKAESSLEKDANSEDFQELKQQSLQHFDEWCSQALGRIQEELQQEMREQKLPNTKDRNVLSLGDLPEQHRVLIMHSCLLLLLGLERYSAESRVFLRRLLQYLELPNSVLVNDESKVAQGLAYAADTGMNADVETQKRIHDKKVARRWMIGAGAAVGATLIGVTGGLAAPLLAAGVGTTMAGIGLGSTAVATYLGAMAGSAPLIGVLFGAYGGKMAGELVGNYAKEVSDFAFIPVRKQTFTKDATVRRLRIAIGISGWITEPPDVVKPWQFVGKEGFESYALRWELGTLLDLGHALMTYAKSFTWGLAKNQIINQTFMATLSAALWPIAIAKAARLIDNPFSIALQRSLKAGRVLADALCNKVQGERPVTLMGYSMGARVIVACLEELAKRRAFGLVENVVLAGAANSRDTKVWRRIKAVVSGRVINAYSTTDHLLAFLFRAHNFKAGVAGLQPVENVPGVENVDVSSIVTSHFQYRYFMGQLMEAVGFEDIDHEAVKREMERLQKEQAQVEAERAEKEKQAKQQGLSPEDEAQQMEEQIQKKRKGAKGRMDDAMADMKGTFSKMSLNKKDKGQKDDGEYNMDVSTKADKEKPTTGTEAFGSTMGGFVPGPGALAP